MPSKRKCENCTHDYPSGEHYCPHCARPANYPNVQDACEDIERRALQDRYDSAIALAAKRGSLVQVREFEESVKASKAVIARSFREADRLAANPNELYATFYGLVKAGVRLRGEGRYELLRITADPFVFPGYHEDIRFGCLTTNDLGLPGYGECYLVLRDNMIAHRSSVFEENILDWVIRLDFKYADAFVEELQLPVGCRATWSERAKLAVAKLADSIDACTPSSDFPNLLLAPKQSDNELDQFIEVHIWGPLSIYAVEEITISASPGESKAEKAFKLGIIDRFKKAQIPCRVI